MYYMRLVAINAPVVCCRLWISELTSAEREFNKQNDYKTLSYLVRWLREPNCSTKTFDSGGTSLAG